MKNIALLGFGVVGSGVADVLSTNKKLIESRVGDEIRIKAILDRKDLKGTGYESIVTTDIGTILNDPEIDIVAEMMGGSHPAYEFSLDCLKAGKSVVTSNKEVVANFGEELLKAAREHNCYYLFEASVGGGIPVIRPMYSDLAPDCIRSVSGIINGTTNYILTKMQDQTPFDSALKEAQEAGYAEADPTADIEGLDAARKIVILTAIASGKMFSTNDIHIEGITHLGDASLACSSFGYNLKLIGRYENVDGKTLTFVSPMAIPLSNPLSGITDVFNGILVNTDMTGDVMFYGKGAGKLPTAAAVVSDILDIVTGKASIHPAWEKADSTELMSFDEHKFSFVVSLHTANFALDDIEAQFGKLSSFIRTTNDTTSFVTPEISRLELNEKLSALSVKAISLTPILK